MDQFDVVIVGAGSAGCALAERLTGDGRRRVLLLEAGGSDRRPWIRIPIGYGKTFFDRRINWMYQTEADPGLGNRTSYWPRGRVLGGSSSINAMVYCRGLPGDFDDWRDAGNPGWGWPDVAPMFAEFERHVAADGSVCGDGPLWVSQRAAEYHPIRRHFEAAAREIGLPVLDDLNTADPNGVAPYAINTRGGLRCSTADAFLHPARHRKNLVIRTNALVERVRFDGRRAVGVEYRMAGERRFAAAADQVILSAGAINSPQILQLSGIGPGAVLKAAGIPVLHANDAVGGGMQDHLGINYFHRATEPTLNQVLGTWRGRIACGLQYLAYRGGPLSLSVNQMGGLVRSTPGAARPDTQLYFNPLSYSIEHKGGRRLLKPDPWPGFILSFNPCRPTSKGRIDIASPDPAMPPRIAPNYLSTEQDIRDVVAGARLIGRFESTAAMRRLIDGPPRFDLSRASDEEIVADFRARCGTVFHACGTCRMAPIEHGGVVDAGLRVYGAERLRVVDAAIFPNVTSANTNAPTIMVAHKAAQLILNSRN
jgi:choline dehydrogenase